MTKMIKAKKIVGLIFLFGITSLISYFAIITLVGEKPKTEKTIEEKVQEETTQVKKQSTEINNGLTKTDNQGEVTISITPLLEKNNEESYVFQVEMNTHSVDLSQFDLNNLTEISIGQNEEVGRITWEPSTNESHHTEGYIKVNGNWKSDFRFLELKIYNINGIKSRTFTWLQEEIS